MKSINAAKAEMLIRKPVREVFEAFVNPEITTKFWFTHSTGRLEEGKTRTWRWDMYNISVPVEVNVIDPNKKIIIVWGTGQERSTVQWDFKVVSPQATFVSITNSDFQESGVALIRQVIDSTQGFNLVVAGLKAWLEHGISLNLVEDKFPIEMRK